MIKSKISVAVLFLLCLCWLPTLALAKGKSHFTVEDSQYGTRLVKWEGKDSVVDFNNIQELKDVKVIGEMAFEMNKYIKQVILPDNLLIIEKRAFNTCANLQTVKMPNTVRYIGNSAFNMDHQLELSVLPDSLQEIGEWTFWDCNKVCISVIPEHVSKIGRQAFTCCEGIKALV
ncbi:MAG: leucine-rich repeat domain-containing protein, partial [Segatella copri]|nr:leucine-rich repeat domain-containing protein [Segatella copri]